MHSKIIKTPLGLMAAVADDLALHVLEFVDGKYPPAGMAAPLASIEQELDLYFRGLLQEFKTPIAPAGSSFQRRVWEALCQIPYGQTVSYKAVAEAVGKPRACRAVGSANGANPLAIIVPCHRVINASGEMGGYAGGLERKEWLLQHEIQTREGSLAGAL
jgi:O-6-methylguanine DNA methyltransferase